jgi:carbon starvation protein CstA
MQYQGWWEFDWESNKQTQYNTIIIIIIIIIIIDVLGFVCYVVKLQPTKQVFRVCQKIPWKCFWRSTYYRFAADRNFDGSAVIWRVTEIVHRPGAVIWSLCGLYKTVCSFASAGN